MSDLNTKPTFTVTRCAVIKYGDDDDAGLYPIAPEQDEEILAIAQLMPWERPEKYNAHQVMAWFVMREGEEQSILVDLVPHARIHEDHPEGFDPCNGDFNGIEWQIEVTGLASTLGLPLISGVSEQRMRELAAELQSLVDVRHAIRGYNDKLNAMDKAPDGNDYNALLALAGI